MVAAGLIAGIVVINQSAVHWRQNNVDSHLFAWQGWCVLHGARPYLDVWDNKPPGILWVNAAGFALCGPGVLAEIVISAFAMAAILVAFVALDSWVVGVPIRMLGMSRTTPSCPSVRREN